MTLTTGCQKFDNLWTKADHIHTAITKLIEEKLDASNAQAEAMARDDEAAAKHAGRHWQDLDGQVEDLSNQHAAVIAEMNAMVQAEAAA